MPLKNAKHELFAQGVAKGLSATEAYEKAGYRPHQPSASRLLSNAMVQARVAELKEKAAEKAVITTAAITERLLSIAAKAETSTEAPMLSVARASLMDAAKLNGLIVEKREHTGPNGGPIQTESKTWRERLREEIQK